MASWRGALACLVLAACGAAERAAGPDLQMILADRPAERLSDYGLFIDAGAETPADGVLAYDLINPLFSDYAEKDRYVFTGGEPAEVNGSEVLELPTGSVLVKHFSYPETGKLETRILIRKADGWRAYPYVWNAAGTEATYAPIGAKLTVETEDPDGVPLTLAYAVPNQNQCKTCHQIGDEIAPIGPKPHNLNHDGPYGRNQLSHWMEAGLLARGDRVFDAVPAIERGEGDARTRGRAYLDINCAHCHRAGGSASNSGLWLEWTEDDPVKLGVGKHPTAAGRGSGQLRHVVVAGAPDASILMHRMVSTEAGVAMPELGRTQVDAEGLEHVHAWIATLETPPQ